MTVLVEQCWREISSGLGPTCHPDTELRPPLQGETEVVDTTYLAPGQGRPADRGRRHELRPGLPGTLIDQDEHWRRSEQLRCHQLPGMAPAVAEETRRDHANSMGMPGSALPLV
jgi:hypothetical protein